MIQYNDTHTNIPLHLNRHVPHRSRHIETNTTLLSPPQFWRYPLPSPTGNTSSSSSIICNADSDKGLEEVAETTAKKGPTLKVLVNQPCRPANQVLLNYCYYTSRTNCRRSVTLWLHHIIISWQITNLLPLLYGVMTGSLSAKFSRARYIFQ